jgi:hypothetical protein
MIIHEETPKRVDKSLAVATLSTIHINMQCPLGSKPGFRREKPADKRPIRNYEFVGDRYRVSEVNVFVGCRRGSSMNTLWNFGDVLSCTLTISVHPEATENWVILLGNN